MALDGPRSVTVVALLAIVQSAKRFCARVAKAGSLAIAQAFFDTLGGASMLVGAVVTILSPWRVVALMAKTL